MAQTQIRSIEFRDFSGGITDDVLDCQPTQYERADNLLIDDQKKLFSRPGSTLWDVSNPRPLNGTERTGFLCNYFSDTDLFAVSGQKIYYYASGWTELSGPTGNPAFPGAHPLSGYNSSEWRRHLFLTCHSPSLPVVIYPSESGAGYRLRTAGLPALPEPLNYSESATLTSALALANELRSDLLAHFNYVTGTYHTIADTVSASLLTAPSATDLTTLLALVPHLMLAHNNHVKDSLSASPSYHPSVLSNKEQIYYIYLFLLDPTQVPTTLSGACDILNQLKDRWNSHDRAYATASPPYGFSATAFSFHDSAGANGGLYPITASSIGSLTSGIKANASYQFIFDQISAVRSALRTHIVSATRHTTGTSPVTYIDSPYYVAPTTLATAIQAVNGIIRAYAVHEADAAKSSLWAYHNAQRSTPATLALVNSVTGTREIYSPALLREDATMSSVATKITDIFTQFKIHTEDTTPHNSTASAAFAFTSPTVGDFVYSFHYKHTYTIDGALFEVDGPVLERSVDDTAVPNQQALILNKIPVLSNLTFDNYPTSTVKVAIFRTKINGTTRYALAEITNGVTEYTDRISDAELGTETLYTTGGVVESQPPPRCRFTHIVDTTAYYGDIYEGAQHLPNVINQAVPGSPEAVPGSFQVELPSQVMGISSYRSIPIGLTLDNVYRLEGAFDRLGRGSIRPVAISDKGGCIGPYSVTQTVEGVFFAGPDGIYFTDGHQVKNISKEWGTTYLSLTKSAAQRRKIFGSYDRSGGRVWFSFSASGEENDVFYVMDLNWGVLEDLAFTTASGGSSFAPTAACFYRGSLIRGDRRGYIFRHDEAYTNDPKIEVSVTPSSWGAQTLIWDLISRSLDYGSIQYRKWSSGLTLKAKNVGDCSIQARSINDQRRSTKDLTPIRVRTNCIWGDPTAVWGASTAIWNIQGEIDEKRHFPANSLRFSDKQIQLTNAFVVIQNSDITGQATVSSAAKTVTLPGPSILWNPDLVDQYIYFDVDAYTARYKITAVSASRLVLTLETAPASATYKWVIKGYPKNERFHLLSFQITAAVQSMSQSDAAGEAAGNA